MNVGEFITSINGFDFYTTKGTRNGSGYRIMKDNKKVFDCESILDLREALLRNILIIQRNGMYAFYQIDKTLKKLSGDYKIIVPDCRNEIYVGVLSLDRVEVRKIRGDSLLYNVVLPIPDELLESYEENLQFHFPVVAVHGNGIKWFYNVVTQTPLTLETKKHCLSWRVFNHFLIVSYSDHDDVFNENMEKLTPKIPKKYF